MGGWEYIKAITSRYHGIGGGRVHVDYEKFVSVFAYDTVKGLWDNDVQSDTRMPRLTNASPSHLAKIKDDVPSLILSKTRGAAHKHKHTPNWHAIADMLIARYSPPLHHITTHHLFRHAKHELATYLKTLLRPFIDSTTRNATLETPCCASHLPSPSTPHTITTRICATLLTSLSIASAPTPHHSFSPLHAEHAVEVAELVRWLQWTSWKECGRCADQEVCFVPVWPMGRLEDHRALGCKGEGGVEGWMGYWGTHGKGGFGGIVGEG